MKQLLLLLLPAAMILSCSKKEEEPAPTPQAPSAKVSFYNGCLNSGQLKATRNDTVIADVSNLDVLQNSGYKNITPGSSIKTSFLLQSVNTALVSGIYNFSVNNYYSVFATGIVTDAGILEMQDDLTNPAAGNAKIRFINLCPDSLNETVYIDTSVITSNVNYKMFTPFYTVSAGSKKIIVQDPAHVPLGITINAQTFTAGKIYTMILTGVKSGSGSSAVQLNFVSNN